MAPHGHPTRVVVNFFSLSPRPSLPLSLDPWFDGYHPDPDSEGGAWPSGPRRRQPLLPVVPSRSDGLARDHGDAWPFGPRRRITPFFQFTVRWSRPDFDSDGGAWSPGNRQFTPPAALIPTPKAPFSSSRRPWRRIAIRTMRAPTTPAALVRRPGPGHAGMWPPGPILWWRMITRPACYHHTARSFVPNPHDGAWAPVLRCHPPSFPPQPQP